MSEINSFSSVKSLVLDRWSEMSNMSPGYLSDKGKAAMEAYRSIYWHMSFHDNFETLVTDEEFNNLINIPGKDPEFYRIIRMLNRKIEKLVN